jgi:hypothetical protein
MSWMDDAKSLIDWIDKQLPPDADLKARKRALREHAWKLHQGTSWGKKVWSKASRAYLERHGLPKRTPDAPPQHLSPLERLMRAAGEMREMVRR